LNSENLKGKIKQCIVCSTHLELGPKPVVSFSRRSKIVIIGQAPGLAVHRSGVPWDDPSGVNLRKWLGVSSKEFYEPDLFAIVPMGFCYPGKGKSGDLPPRPECAPLWHNEIISTLSNVELTLLIGSYAQKYYLKSKLMGSLTHTVESYLDYLPKYFVLPHPSPRNNIWMSKNPWFKKEVIPKLQSLTKKILA
jgi:uracil-DNA glycosylase